MLSSRLTFIDYSIWCFPHLASFLYPDVLPHSHLKCFPLIYLCSICYASMRLTCTCTFITPDVLPQHTFTPCDVHLLMYLYHNWQQDIPLSHLMSPSEMDSENPGLFTSWISWSVPIKKILNQARLFLYKQDILTRNKTLRNPKPPLEVFVQSLEPFNLENY